MICIYIYILYISCIIYIYIYIYIIYLLYRILYIYTNIIYIYMYVACICMCIYIYSLFTLFTQGIVVDSLVAKDALDRASCDAVAVGKRREVEHLAQGGATGARYRILVIKVSQ